MENVRKLLELCGKNYSEEDLELIKKALDFAQANLHGKKEFSGKSFVITGTLPKFSRQQAKEFIERHGGRVTGSVSKKTSYLVLGENPGSKYAEAEGLGISILDEEGLRKLVS